MIFPRYIKKGDTIAVTAPSHSIDREADQERFLHGKEMLKEAGYEVYFTDNVFKPSDSFGRSGTPQEKAKEFNECIEDKSVSAIISASGGDFLAEMLPYVDLEAVKENPKWFQGYSDNTSLAYYITTKADVATAYGATFSDFGMDPWQECVTRGLGVLEGKVKVQKSFKTFNNGMSEREKENIYRGYGSSGKVCWKNVCGEEDGKITMTGRLLGGCLDVLMNISGTRYDGTLEFMEKYKDDGIIWFLEGYDLAFAPLMEALWKLKEMGWFKYAKGIVFGRPLLYPEERFDGFVFPSYETVLKERLGELNIPVIMDADIGHKGPQFVMIEGAMAKVESSKGKGKVTYL